MCLPRTGSTNIRKYIEESNKEYITYNEPFNPQIEPRLTWPIYPYKDIIDSENLFIKGMCWHISKDFSNLTLNHFYSKLIEDFDKVIFLDRLGVDDISRSLSTAQVSGVYHQKYISEREVVTEEHYENTYSYILDKKNIMQDLSEKFNIPIFHYEDLFNNKENFIHFIKETLNLEYNESVYTKFLDLNNRYKIENKIKSII